MNQKNWIIGLVILVVILVGGVTFFVVGRKSEPVIQQPSSTPTQAINTLKPSSTQVSAVSLLDTIKNYIKIKSSQNISEGGGGEFCYTGPSLDSIGANEKDSNSSPDLLVEDVRQETVMMTDKGGGKVPTVFVYAKIKNNGKTISDTFFTTYKWTYLGETRTYDDLIGIGPIFSGKYLGGLKDPSLEQGACESGYPWTPVKFGSNLKSGDRVEIILDSNNQVKESNETNNTFVYTIK